MSPLSPIVSHKSQPAAQHRSPEAIMDEIAALDAESVEVLGEKTGQATLSLPLEVITCERRVVPRIGWPYG